MTFERIRRLKSTYPTLQLFVISITVLAQLDGLIALSRVLSNILDHWRDLIHFVIEEPINMVLQVINIPEIDIPSPIPEAVVVLGMFLLCGRQPRKISNLPLSQFIDKFRSIPYLILPDDNNRFSLKVVFSIALATLLNLVATIPALIVTSILLQSIILAVIALGSLAFIQVSLSGRYAQWLESALEVYGFYLCAVVLLNVVGILTLFFILEAALPLLKVATT